MVLSVYFIYEYERNIDLDILKCFYVYNDMQLYEKNKVQNILFYKIVVWKFWIRNYFSLGILDQI